MKIIIADSIKAIPNHEQFQELALTLQAKGHEVYHFTDNSRTNYGVKDVISVKNQNIPKKLLIFNSYVKTIKPDIVISTFRSNLIFDLLSHFYKFSFFPVYQSDYFGKGLKYKLYYRKVKKLLTVSSILKDNVEQTYFPHLKGKVVNIGNSFNPDDLSTPEKQDKENIILFVGSLNSREGQYVKGIDILIDAFNFLKLDSWKLQIIGDGENRNELQSRFEKKDVQFLGRLLYPEVMKLMARSKVLCVPSRYEAFGNIYYEGAFHGCAVIGSKGTGAEDLIREGIYGYLVESGSKESLIDALSKAIKSYSSPEESKEFHSNTLKKFERDTWVNNMLKIIEVA